MSGCHAFAAIRSSIDPIFRAACPGAARTAICGMLFSLLCLAIACVLIGVGVVFGLVAVGLTFTLVGAGMVSSSVMIGVWRGRAQSGLRAFLLQCGILAGIPAGMLCAWVATSVWEQIDGTLVAILAAGGLAGALGGAVVALMFDFLASRVHGWLAARLDGVKARTLQQGQVSRSTLDR
jgi:hypothetical protein